MKLEIFLLKQNQYNLQKQFKNVDFCKYDYILSCILQQSILTFTDMKNDQTQQAQNENKQQKNAQNNCQEDQNSKTEPEPNKKQPHSHEIQQVPKNQTQIRKRSSKFLYKVHGQPRSIKINTEEFRQRLLNMLSDLKETSIITVSKDSQQKNIKNDPEKPKELVAHRTQLRYYDDLEQPQHQQIKVIKCHRCNRLGHQGRYCTWQKQRFKCYYCTKNHYKQYCTQVLCNCCGEMGHQSVYCEKRREKQCSRCGKRGHISQDCGVIIFKESSAGTYDMSLFDQQDLEKASCVNDCSMFPKHYACKRDPPKKVIIREQLEQGQLTPQSELTINDIYAKYRYKLLPK